MEPWESNPFAPPQAELMVGPGALLDGDPRPVPFEDLEAEPRFWPRVWAMFRLLFTQPGDLADRVPNSEGLGAPIRFTLLLSTPLMLLYMGIFGLVGVFAMAEARPLNPGDPPGWAFLLMGPGFAAVVAVMMMIAIPIGGLILHLCLWMLGGTRNGTGLGQTLRVTGYYWAFHVLSAPIPLVNFFVALGGPAFLGMALARIHRTDTWRGIVAAYLPLGLCCCLYAVFFAVLAGMGAFK